MNRGHDSPAEWNPDTGSAEEWRELVEIERRLKEARPRPPALDWAAIEQIAHADQVEPARSRESEDLDRIRWPRRIRSYRPFLTIASSWICGAAVGVSMTLLLVQRPSVVVEVARGRIRENSGVFREGQRPPPPPSSHEFGYFPSKCATSNAVVGPAAAVVRDDDQIAETTDETPAEMAVEQTIADVRPESRPVAAAETWPSERPSLDDTVMAAIADPFGGSLGSDVESPVLSVGILLRRPIGGPFEAPLIAANAGQPDFDKTVSDQPPRGMAIDLVPPRPSTRERLLEELLRETSGFLVF